MPKPKTWGQINLEKLMGVSPEKHRKDVVQLFMGEDFDVSVLSCDDIATMYTDFMVDVRIKKKRETKLCIG